jgi:DNA-binding transcriptional ArsR family regulator
MSLPGVMKHIDVLERAGLIRKLKKGRTVHCQLDAANLEGAAEWISRYQSFWEQKLDSLAKYLEELESTGE